MPRRFAKQLLYGGLFLLIFIGVVFVIYSLFFRSEPSCFDMKQNQREEGIDCGGPCENVCLPEGFRQIELIDGVKLFRPAAGRLSILADIQNPNEAVAARNFEYRFEIYDDGGKLIRRATGRSFIYSREVKRLAEFLKLGTADLGAVSRVEFQIENAEWVRADDFPKPAITVQEQRLNAGGDALQVTGRIANSDTVRFPAVTVLAVFYGQLGKPVGVSETELDDLMPGESRQFTIAHPRIQNLDSPRVEISISARRP